MNKKIAILDFVGARVYIREVPDDMRDEQADDVMAYFEQELGLHADDCQYMMGDLSIDIQ